MGRILATSTYGGVLHLVTPSMVTLYMLDEIFLRTEGDPLTQEQILGSNKKNNI